MNTNAENTMVKESVRQSLMKQLHDKGADVSHFVDLVNDYMALWAVKDKLVADIDGRGITYVDVSSVGVKMTKNNPSVKELIMVNKQMLMVLKELGLTTDNCLSLDSEEL